MSEEVYIHLSHDELFLMIMCMGLSVGTFLKIDAPPLFQRAFYALLTKLGEAYEKTA